MKGRVRQILIVGIVVIMATALVSWPSVLRYGIQSGLQQARRGGQQVSWSGLSTGMNSASFENLTVWVPGPKVKGTFSIPVSVELQDLAVTLNVWSLVAFRPSLTYTTSLYGGSLKGSALHTDAGEEVSASIEGVEVGKHPQLASLGVRGGAITALFEQVVITPQGPSQGTFSLALRQLAPPLPSTAKTLLKVDDLGTFDLNATGKISPQSIHVTDIKLASVFGKASGSLTALNHLSGSPNLSATFQVSLSEKGTSTLGPWLPLIPGAGLDSTTTNFSVRANSIPCGNLRGDATTIRIGAGCVKLSCNRG